MYLFIDTSIKEYIRVGLLAEGKLVSKKSVKVGFHYSEKMLSVVDALLRQRHPEFISGTKPRRSRTEFGMTKELKAVLVVSGPGRFSALRTGVTTANTLAWALNILVIDVQSVLNVEDVKGYWREVEQRVGESIKKIRSKKFGSFVVPKYGAAPNITLKKK